MHAKKTLSIASTLLAGSLALTGCGSDSGNSNHNGGASTNAGTEASRAHNEADTSFAQQMIPHHGQAIDMAKMARTHASSAQVKQLAADIEAAQGPEIAKMTAWLKAWGENVPSTDMTGMAGMDHGGNHSLPGMMTTDDMNRLGRAHGAEFDRMFLQMMIDHHQGAIEMARTERAQGRNAQAVHLAEGIQSSQAAEIAKMRKMLSS